MGNEQGQGRLITCGRETTLPVLHEHPRVMRTKSPATYESELRRGRERVAPYNDASERRRSVTPEPTSKGLKKPVLMRRVGLPPRNGHLAVPGETTTLPSDGVLPTDHEGPSVSVPPLIMRRKAVELTDIEKSDAVASPPTFRPAISPIMMRRQNAPVYTAGEEISDAPYERLVASPWKPITTLPVSADESDRLLATHGTMAREEVYVPASVWDTTDGESSAITEAGSVSTKTWNMNLNPGDKVPDTITLRDPSTGTVLGVYTLTKSQGNVELSRPVLPRGIATDPYEYETGLTSSDGGIGQNNLIVGAAQMFHENPLSPHNRPKPPCLRRPEMNASRCGQLGDGLGRPVNARVRSEPNKRRRRVRRGRPGGRQQKNNAGYELYPSHVAVAARIPPAMSNPLPPAITEISSCDEQIGSGPSQWVSFTESPVPPTPTLATTSQQQAAGLIQLPAANKYSFARPSDGVVVLSGPPVLTTAAPVVCEPAVAADEKLFCEMVSTGG